MSAEPSTISTAFPKHSEHRVDKQDRVGSGQEECRCVDSIQLAMLLSPIRDLALHVTPSGERILTGLY